MRGYAPCGCSKREQEHHELQKTANCDLIGRMNVRHELIRGMTLFLICLLFALTAVAASQEYFVYIGTYTRSRGKGI